MHKLALVLLAGCLGPQVSDEVQPAGLILVAGTPVPSIYDDAEEADQIAAHDGVPDLVPLLSGFADGKPVQFWNLGPAPAFTAPFYVLARRDPGGTLMNVSHPPIVGAVPGDAAYSPFWIKAVVEVTDRYSGEIIPSLDALNEAVVRGLVKAPQLTTLEINCPIVHDGARLDAGPGAAPIEPQGTFYYEGKAGKYFAVGATSIADSAHVPVLPLYELTRLGGLPLSEPDRQVDIDGDGDALDTNDIFGALPGDAGWSPLCQVTEVTVPATVASIDTTHDQTKADLRAASDLFAGGAPVAGVVLGYQTTTRRFDCAIKAAP
jgi:hypothetical protein